MRKLAWVVLAAAVLAGCGKKQDQAAESTLVYARAADSKKLDPADITDGESANVTTQIFDTLVEFEDDSSQRVRPALAISWGVTPDALTWTFKLRAGVKFHDGTPCDTAAVVRNFDRLVKTDSPDRFGIKAPYGEMYNIAKTEGQGDSIVFTLTKPNAAFLADLAMFPAAISSPAAINQWKGDYGQHPVGTGPFRFKSWEPDQKIVLEANKEYWGGAPKSATLVFAVVPEPARRLERLKSGEVHIIDNPALSDLSAISGNSALKLLQRPGMNFAYLAMNVEKAPFDSPKVRQAVASAIDKKELIALGFDGVGESGPVLMPRTVWGYDESIAEYPYDPESAKKAVAEAGVTGKEITLYVMTTSRPYMPTPDKVGSLIKQKLEAIGFKPVIVAKPFPGYLDDIDSGKHDICLYGWSTDNGDPDNFLFTLFHSSAIGATNAPRYRSKEFDALVEKAQAVSDMAERTKLYHEAEAVLRRDTPAVTLAYMPIVAGTRANVTGFRLHPMGLLRLKDAALTK